MSDKGESNLNLKRRSSGMRLTVVICCFAGGALLLGSIVGQLMSLGVPELEVFEPVYNFGDVPVNSLQDGSFQLGNSGKAELVVRISKVSCSCTVSDISELRIAPGENASLPFLFKVDGKEGGCGSTILIDTNDPNNPQFTLGIHAFAFSVINLSPPTLYLGSRDVETLPAIARLEITPGNAAPKNLLDGIVIIGPEHHLEINETRTNSSIELSIQLLSDVPLGLYKDSVKIQFKKYANYEIEVPVIAEIKGTYRARPSSMDFGLIQKGEAVEIKCRIKKQYITDSVQILEITSALSSIFEAKVEVTDSEMFIIGTILLSNEQTIIDEAFKIKIASSERDYILRIPVTCVSR
jgi:Protein of unknown function (DUF1573)